MRKERGKRKFGDRYAKLYDFEIHRFSGSAYVKMYRLMSCSLTKEMKVLEIATGTFPFLENRVTILAEFVYKTL